MTPSRPSAISLLLAALTFLVTTLAARAQPIPAAGSLATGGHASHAWAALQAGSGPGQSPGAMLVHFPPRAPQNLKPAEDGAMRLVTLLPSQPEALAAWDAQLFVLFPLERQGERPVRRMMSLGVRPGPVDGTWVYTPSGRLTPEPVLEGDARLVGFTATALGPVALLETAQARTLSIRGDSGWSTIPLPDALLTSGASRLSLGASPAGVLVLEIVADPSAGSEPRATLWQAALEGTRVDAAVRASWTSARVELPRGFSTSAAGSSNAQPRDVEIASVRGSPILCWDRAGTLEIERLDGERVRHVASLGDVSARRAMIPFDDSGRVAVLWVEPPAETPASPPPAGPAARAARSASGLDGQRIRIAEISAATGVTLYSGPVRGAQPVSSFELKLLAMGLVIATMIVMVFVLKPMLSVAALSLPRGYALADPGRRMVAGLIDLVLAAVVVWRITATPVSEILSVVAWFSSPGAFAALLMTLGLGLVVSTLSEWLFGRTPGKLVCGIQVVQPLMIQSASNELTPAVRRPTFARALVRNLARWLLPPLAFGGLSAPEGRHRGDLVAGTVVVSRVAPDTEHVAGEE